MMDTGGFCPWPTVTLHTARLDAVYRLALAGYEHRRRLGIPLRQTERDAVATLGRAMTATNEQAQRHRRHAAGGSYADWITADDVANQRGCSVRTVQRNAAAMGGRKVGNKWLFPPYMSDKGTNSED